MARGWFLLVVMLGCRGGTPPRAGIVIQLVHPASSLENEQLLDTLERASSAVPGLAALDGEADGDGVRVVVWFASPADAESGMTPLRDAIGEARSRLPSDADPPMLTRTSPGRVLRYVVSGEVRLAELAAAERHLVREPLEMSAGVRGVETCGEVWPEDEIVVDGERLAAYGLTVTEVIDAVRAGGDPRGLSLTDRIRLTDVAQLHATTTKPRCQAYSMGGNVGPVIVGSVEGDPALRKVVEPRLRELAKELPRTQALWPLNDGIELVIETPRGTLPDDAVRLAARLGDALRTLPAVTRVVAMVHDDGVIELVVLGATAEALRQRLRATPELVIRVRGEELWIAISGPDRAALRTAADLLREALGRLDGVSGIGLRGEGGRPSETGVVDRARAAELGVPLSEIATTLAASGEGMRPAPGIRLRVEGSSSVRGNGGARIPIDQLVRRDSVEHGTLLHRDRQPALLVWVASPDPSRLRSRVEELLAQHPLPPGIRVRIVQPERQF